MFIITEEKSAILVVDPNKALKEQLNALFNGKYCIVNKTTAAITELSELCSIANTSEEYIKIITALYQEPFTILQTEKRKKLLHTVFNNTRNAKQQITWIWGMDI